MTSPDKQCNSYVIFLRFQIFSSLLCKQTLPSTLQASFQTLQEWRLYDVFKLSLSVLKGFIGGIFNSVMLVA